MADPVTWQALDAIRTALQAITVVGGYYTNLGSNVRAELYQDEIGAGALLCVVGAERITPTEPATRVRAHSIEVSVECIVAATDINAQRKAHECIADVLRVFPAGPKVLPMAAPLSLEVLSTEASVLIRPDGIAAVAAQVKLLARLREQL